MGDSQGDYSETAERPQVPLGGSSADGIWLSVGIAVSGNRAIAVGDGFSTKRWCVQHTAVSSPESITADLSWTPTVAPLRRLSYLRSIQAMTP